MLSDETATSKFLTILKWLKNFNDLEHKNNLYENKKTGQLIY